MNKSKQQQNSCNDNNKNRNVLWPKEMKLEINEGTTFCWICKQSGMIAMLIWTQEDSCEVCKRCIDELFNKKTVPSYRFAKS